MLLASVDKEDYSRFVNVSWLAVIGTSGIIYAYNRSAGGFLHTLIVNPKPGYMVDHIDRDGLNCVRSNLRQVTASQNQMNKIKQYNSVSNYKGVSWDITRNRWIVFIRVNGKLKFLGRYIDEVEAAKAYDNGAKKYFGEFARINFNG